MSFLKVWIMRSFASVSPLRRLSVALLALSCAPIGVAAAQDFYVPPYTIDLSLEVGADSIFKADDPDAELTDVFGSAELAVRLEPTEALAVNFGATLESVLDPEKDRAFEDIGLYVDTLNLEAAVGPVTVTAGKFAPSFGAAFDAAPGIWGGDLAGDYELTEQLGVGVSGDVYAPVVGDVTLSANLFAADTTFLSDSAFTRRGRLRRADGGAGNTGTPESFSLTASGAAVEALPGFSWNLGYRRLKAGEGDYGSEQGFVAGAGQEFALSDDTTLTAFGEIARFTNAGGSEDRATYATLGLGAVHGPWHAELAAATVRGKGPGGDWDDDLFQVSGGYVFENGVDLSLGYARASAGDFDANVLGLRLSRDFSF